MQLEATISVGNILTIVAMIGSWIAAFYAMRADIRVLNAEVKLLAIAVEKIGDILQTLARQDQRLISIESQIEDLKHGRGFVFEFGAQPHTAGPYPPNTKRRD